MGITNSSHGTGASSGKDLAVYLYDRGKNFYDLDQRTIDTYLGSLFSM